MKKFLKNIIKLKKILTIKDFRFGTFPSMSGSGSGSGYTFYRPPLKHIEETLSKMVCENLKNRNKLLIRFLFKLFIIGILYLLLQCIQQINGSKSVSLRTFLHQLTTPITATPPSKHDSLNCRKYANFYVLISKHTKLLVITI